MRRILLSGFEPFHKSTLNPSQEVVKQISHPALVAKEVLPVTFGEASTQLIELIELHRPDVVISLGQAEGRSEITPEQVAINLDDARIPDNAGNQPLGRAIIPGAPDAYFTTLPIKELVSDLNQASIPASISFSAGTFVCNHIFYTMQHHCNGRGIVSGFIHLPLMEEQAGEFRGLPTMNIEQMIKGVKRILDLVS